MTFAGLDPRLKCKGTFIPSEVFDGLGIGRWSGYESELFRGIALEGGGSWNWLLGPAVLGSSTTATVMLDLDAAA